MMLLQLECIPCILNVSALMIRLLNIDETRAREIFSDIMQLPSLRLGSNDITSPDVIELAMTKIMAVSGDPDPFSLEKRKQNDIALELYPSLRALIEDSNDPLLMAVKLAIVGNAIDFMVPHSTERIERTIKENLEFEFPEKEYKEFENRLMCSNLVLIFGDNSGEIVLDRLLIETIRKARNPDIVYIVKSTPAMNDSTLAEAQYTGMDRVARVLENGIQGPFPGTRIRRCSTEVRELVRNADMIISKGGGNFDSLDEEKEDMRDRITFLFLSKCEPYYRRFGVPPFQPIMASF
jgi:uncharacterized protein with ATP-grasp and redox domains